MARNWSLPICPAWRMSQGWTTGPVAPAEALPARAARTISSISCWFRTFSIACSRVSNHSIGTTLRQFPRCCPRFASGGGGRGQEIEPGTQPDHRQGMNLRDARFANAERGSNFLHGEFFVVVERQHTLFLFRQFGNCLLQQLLRLRAQALKKRLSSGFAGM